MMFLLVLIASYALCSVSKAQTPDVQGCLRNDLFSLFSDVRTASAARDFCATQGGTLARISSDEEHAFVTDLTADVDIDRFWIGVADVNEEGGAGTSRFSYVDGSTENLEFIHTEVGVFPWGSGEPNDFKSAEFCVEWRKDDNDRFNDAPCTADKGYLCRSPCPTTSPTKSPTKTPTTHPTTFPTKSPTFFPSTSPTRSPTLSPTLFPSTSPTRNPTLSPTSNPTQSPTNFTEPLDQEITPMSMVFLGGAGLSFLGIGFVLIVIFKEKRDIKRLKERIKVLDEELEPSSHLPSDHPNSNQGLMPIPRISSTERN